MRHVDKRGRRGRKLVNVVQHRLKESCRRNDPLRDAFGQARDRGLFSVNEEYAPLNRAACCDPSCNFGPVGMTRIFIDHADASGHLDLVALDSNGLGAILKKPAESAMGLKADQEHGGPVVPQPMFEMMANAAGVAHAACRDNDMKAGQFCDRFAFVDCLGESEMWRVEQAIDVDIPIEASSVFSLKCWVMLKRARQNRRHRDKRFGLHGPTSPLRVA